MLAARLNAVGLLSETEFLKKLRVTLPIHARQIVEKPAALADQLDEAVAAVMVFCVSLAVSGKVVDPFRQQGDLHITRAGILFFLLKFLDNFSFFLFGQRHRIFLKFRNCLTDSNLSLFSWNTVYDTWARL